MWKNKATESAHQHQVKITNLKDAQTKMKSEFGSYIKDMHSQNTHYFQMIAKKQLELEENYCQKLKQCEKENRQLNKRVVDHRHALVLQKYQE